MEELLSGELDEILIDWEAEKWKLIEVAINDLNKTKIKVKSLLLKKLKHQYNNAWCFLILISRRYKDKSKGI